MVGNRCGGEKRVCVERVWGNKVVGLALVDCPGCEDCEQAPVDYYALHLVDKIKHYHGRLLEPDNVQEASARALCDEVMQGNFDEVKEPFERSVQDITDELREARHVLMTRAAEMEQGEPQASVADVQAALKELKDTGAEITQVCNYKIGERAPEFQRSVRPKLFRRVWRWLRRNFTLPNFNLLMLIILIASALIGYFFGKH